MKVILKCPICREKFKYDVADGWPDDCQVCGANISNKRDDDDVVMPNILSFKTKNNDKVARDIMDGSEVRAELAAAQAGVPVSEMSSLKITNLNDRNDSQFSAPEVRNPVTERMDQMAKAGLKTGFGVAEAQSFAAQAHAGPEPYAGLRARNRVQNAMTPIGSAPLPNEITRNPNYRSPV